MALDSTRGYMFFARWGDSGAAIEKANLDGSNRTVIISQKIYNPRVVSLDLAMQQIYWSDSSLNYIQRVNYDGKNRQSLHQTIHFISLLPSNDAFTFSVFENNIFLASSVTGNMTIIDKYVSGENILIENSINQLSIHIFHRQKQPEIAHPCRDNNGGCEHICVPAWNKNIAVVQCLCVPGYTLKSKTQCVYNEISPIVLYAREISPAIRGISTLQDSSSVEQDHRDSIVPITNVGWPITFDYNVKDQLVYFGNKDPKHDYFRIESQRLDGFNRQLIIDKLIDVSSVAYDWMGHNIYWTNTVSNKITALSLFNTTMKKDIIIKNINHPMSLVLDPKYGMMYWSTWASSNNKIEQAWMDGSHRNVLVDSTSSKMRWPTGLTIDHSQRKIYWCDSLHPVIESINLDGTNRQPIFKIMNHNFHPMSLTYNNFILYWTDQQHGNIQRVHLNNTSVLEIIVSRKPSLYNLKVFDFNTQSDTNLCTNFSCPGICIYTPKKPVCTCGDGFSLNASGTKCIPQLNYIVPSDCPLGNFEHYIFFFRLTI